MDDTKVDNYNNGITEIITLLKEMNSGLVNQISNLNVEVINLNHLINSLRDDNAILLARNIELETMHNKNSNNSSKPPSTNNNKKPSNSRTKTGRSSGGQSGHIGKTLLKIDNPNNIIDITKEICRCGCNLSGVEGNIQTRQVVDLPQIVMNVTEYRTYEVVCPDCKVVNKTEFPATVAQPVQYGENCRL